MEFTVRTLSEEPGLRERFPEFHRQAWPRFIHEGNGAGPLWPRIFTDFADFQFGLWDEVGALVAIGNSIPLICDGSMADLPPDIPEILERGVAVKRDGRRPTALSALAAIVDPAHRSRGVSRPVIEAMGEIARRHGLKTLVAPVRPSLKQLYPLTPMERYVTWTRADGGFFDPWLRVHQRMGAEIMRVAPKAMVVTDTVVRWEEWTGLRFPESGSYVVAGAFQPVKIDVRRDIGRYEEANVWMRHPIAPHPTLSPAGRGKLEP
jgi:GNAT superfamily N-acetyltransferase